MPRKRFHRLGQRRVPKTSNRVKLCEKRRGRTTRKKMICRLLMHYHCLNANGARRNTPKCKKLDAQYIKAKMVYDGVYPARVV
jgi:hypothetical protein